jgi:hypothetical protein
MDLGPEDIILGLLWLHQINSEVNWDTGTMELPDSPEPDPLPNNSLFEKISANRATRRMSVAETRLDAAQESNRGSRRRGVKRLDALTHTAIAYAATSP